MRSLLVISMFAVLSIAASAHAMTPVAVAFVARTAVNLGALGGDLTQFFWGKELYVKEAQNTTDARAQYLESIAPQIGTFNAISSSTVAANGLGAIFDIIFLVGEIIQAKTNEINPGAQKVSLKQDVIYLICLPGVINLAALALNVADVAIMRDLTTASRQTAPSDVHDDLASTTFLSALWPLQLNLAAAGILTFVIVHNARQVYQTSVLVSERRRYDPKSYRHFFLSLHFLFQ